MRALVAESDTALRDQIVIGLEVFGGIDSDQANGSEVLELAAKRDYDFIVYGFATHEADEIDILARLQAMDRPFEILVVAREAAAKKLAAETSSRKIFSTVRRPLQPLSFYRTLNRLKRRLNSRRAPVGAG